MKVLVAEDNPVIREGYLELLPSHGYEVVAAVDNGFAAVEEYRLRMGEIDLVLLDNNMPWMTGLDAAHFIHRLDPNAHIVLATGAPPDEESIRQAGIRSVIRKPFTIDILIRLLNEKFERPAEAALDEERE